MMLYKSPVTSLKPNQTFNFYLSRICIQSEHIIGYLKGRFQFLKELCFQVLNLQDLTYVTLQINICIVIHAFCLDHELEIEEDQLKDGIDWEKDQNQDIERNQVAERIPVSGKRARQALVMGKRVCEHKKHQLLQILNDSTYLQVGV